MWRKRHWGFRSYRESGLPRSLPSKHQMCVENHSKTFSVSPFTLLAQPAIIMMNMNTIKSAAELLDITVRLAQQSNSSCLFDPKNTQPQLFFFSFSSFARGQLNHITHSSSQPHSSPMGKLRFTTCAHTYFVSGRTRSSEGVENTSRSTVTNPVEASVAFVTS